MGATNELDVAWAEPLSDNTYIPDKETTCYSRRGEEAFSISLESLRGRISVKQGKAIVGSSFRACSYASGDAFLLETL